MNANGMQGKAPVRELWKALADTGRADYFRWTFKTPQGEIVLSVGKAYGPEGMRHAASPDTAEVLLWNVARPRVDLAPQDISVDLAPWSHFFSDDTGGPIALHMPDSILTSLLFALGHYYEKTTFRNSLLNAFYHRAAAL